MRVLMVTPGYYPIKGGTEIVVHNLCVELNRRGVTTDVMTFNMDQKWEPKWNMKNEIMHDYNIYRIPALNWLPIHNSKINLDINLIPGRFRYLLKNYDIIHFHGSDDLTFPAFSFLVNKPKIFHSHGFYDVKNYKRYLNKYILKSIANRYISITRLDMNELRELGIPKDKIDYLPHSVDTASFAPMGNKINNMVLFVGRIQYIKGLHILLKALQYISKPVNLFIIGPRVLPYEYYNNTLKTIEEINRKGTHVISYLGSMDMIDLIQWYQKAAILVCPSLAESFGMVNIEALSCGTPVIATSVGGIPEIVHDNKNGLLFPFNNHMKLAECLQYLLDNEEVRIKFGKEGRKGVMELFSHDRVIKRLIEIYQKLL